MPYFFHVSHQTSAREKLIGLLGCSIDQLELLNCETLRESGGTWEPFLVSVMGKKCLQHRMCTVLLGITEYYYV